MRVIYTLLLGLLLMLSCKNTDSGKIIRDKFISEYRFSFLHSDLTLFSYDTRVKFEYFNDSVQYRFFVRKDNKLLISLWSNKQQLDTTDKIQCFLFNYVEFLNRNHDSIEKQGITQIKWLSKYNNDRLVLLGDSNKVFPIPHNTFKFDPISYFKSLDSLVAFYGITAIRKYSDHTMLIFDQENSLVYYPNIHTIDTTGMNLIGIDDKWYLSPPG